MAVANEIKEAKEKNERKSRVAPEGDLDLESIGGKSCWGVNIKAAAIHLHSTR